MTAVVRPCKPRWSVRKKATRMIYDHEIKTIALCLDNDKAGKEVTDSMQSVVGNSGLDIKLKQAALPDRIKDPDQMTKERSTEAFKAVINEATVLSKTLE